MVGTFASLQMSKWDCGTAKVFEIVRGSYTSKNVSLVSSCTGSSCRAVEVAIGTYLDKGHQQSLLHMPLDVTVKHPDAGVVASKSQNQVAVGM